MTRNTENRLRLQRFLPYRLFVLASRISHSLAKHYEQQFQITRPEWRVLAVLGETPGLSAAEVAERTAMDKVAVSRAVTKLLKQDMLMRQFSPEDKRRSALSLSDDGKATYQKIIPIALAYEEKIIGQLSAAEVELLDTLVEKLASIDLDL